MTDTKMEYTRLGKSGLKISKVILGTMSYGSPDWEGWILNEDEALPLLEHAYKVGINTWDTADLYSNGKSEEIIGKALKVYNIPRERVVILSKCFYPVPTAEWDKRSAKSATDDQMINRQGLSRKYIFDAVDASVKRLGTYLDVLQIHRLDRETPKEEIMKALNDVVESGKMAAWEFQTLQHIAERNGWHKFICMQSYHNLLYREDEREMNPYCVDSGVGLIPWSPLAKGVLARPWAARSSTREATDASISGWYRSGDDEADREIVQRVEQLARKHGVPMAAVATAWSLSKSLTNPIVGLSSKERIDQAVQATKLTLDKDDVRFLEEPYRPKALLPLY
ncbi:MAG: hypothetical protein M1838_005047 [Thelocarpon superellum]|nr:MAG: hypothetical protein M1838_005047 [Thelocarpon superellum]